MMSYRFYIDSDNAYLTLAMQSILDEIGSEVRAAPKRRMRIVLLSEKKRIQDILAGKKRRLEEYDLIVCSEPYYSLCRQYLGKATRRIVSMDKGMAVLHRDLQAFLEQGEDVLSTYDVSQLMTLTLDERITITDYISQHNYQHMAQRHARDVKTISRFKRAAMLKLGYRSNMQLWLAMNFLFYLGYISQRQTETNNRGVYHPRPGLLHDIHCRL